MAHRHFPTTTDYFPTFINTNAVYVDKTQFIVPLVTHETQSNFFLSRPRRFGKSLFMSSLEQVFLGNKELFKGLYIYDKIEWESYPVIRLSMDAIGFPSIGLEQALFAEVKGIAKQCELTLEETGYDRCFKELIIKLSEKHQKPVVILIDEYDKPIISYIEKENTVQAEKNRDILKSFYGIMIAHSKYLRFVFMTGVSKLSKVSIFSDLNYFDDLTLDNEYVTICGFTEAEIKQNCQEGIASLAAKEGVSEDAIMAKIKEWYDGFSWNGLDFVYNPYSTMRLMSTLQFNNYWFESGTPTFLVRLINKANRYNFENVRVEKDNYNWHDLKRLDYTSIMLQTGYLTFKKPLGGDYFKAEYPNKEVEKAFARMLLKGYMYQDPSQVTENILDIQEAFEQHNLEKVVSIIKNMFETLPSHFFQEEKEVIDAKGNKKTVTKAVGESFYHAIVYLTFSILGVRMPVEVASNEGRIDAVVETNEYIYIFEFKKDRKAQFAIDQITEKNYPKAFALSKKKIWLLGISFTLQKKGVSDYVITPFPIPPKIA
jgi:Predicted AAA-ATPase/PD-(D/E)XK nuclease superfamily